jgi:preprotein translocase subunit YajC
MNSLPQVLANAGAPPEAGLMSFLPLVLMFVAFYFFLIAPQRKQQKAIAKFQSELKVGDPVMTSGGIFGKVVSLQDAKVTVQVAEGVKLTFLRSAILADDTAKAS